MAKPTRTVEITASIAGAQTRAGTDCPDILNALLVRL
jgi:hypothetical protein